jgi:hypothetical protein
MNLTNGLRDSIRSNAYNVEKGGQSVTKIISECSHTSAPPRARSMRAQWELRSDGAPVSHTKNCGTMNTLGIKRK